MMGYQPKGCFRHRCRRATHVPFGRRGGGWQVDDAWGAALCGSNPGRHADLADTSESGHIPAELERVARTVLGQILVWKYQADV